MWPKVLRAILDFTLGAADGRLPRGPRLDAPRALHHVFARGIERGTIFFDDVDRDDFLARLGSIASQGALSVYAWALMPNHFHLLVRTGARPLERSMRSLLSGYATRVNRRHQRAGHLFQNRYRSTLCEEEAYFLALVRYIHRNPIPTVVGSERELATYPFTGHSAVVGAIERPWQDRDAVLSRFGSARTEALERYVRFIGTPPPDDLDLEGGGLRRSRNAWELVTTLARGRECFRADERILGSGAFVEEVLVGLSRPLPCRPELPRLVQAVCEDLGVARDLVHGNGRSRVVTRAREGIAYLWIHRLGGSARSLSRHLGLTPAPVQRAAGRGARRAPEWNAILDKVLKDATSP